MHPLFANKSGKLEDRKYDLSRTFASLYNYLNYSYLFGLSESGWEFLFSKGWLLFNGLKHDQLKEISKRSEAGNSFEEDYINTIAQDLKERIETLPDTWKNSPLLEDHMEVIERAIERYLAGDFISVSSIVYPRIEGIMRTFHSRSKSTPLTQRNLTESIVDKHFVEHRQSLLVCD